MNFFLRNRCNSPHILCAILTSCGTTFFMYSYKSWSKGLTALIVPFAMPWPVILASQRAASNVKPIPMPSTVLANLLYASVLSGSVAKLSNSHPIGPSNSYFSCNIAARLASVGFTNDISTAPKPTANAPISSPLENLPFHFAISFVPVNNWLYSLVPFTAYPAGTKNSVAN